MKNPIVLLALAIASLPSYAAPTADETAQIATVEQLYRLSAADHGTADLQAYVSSAFKQVLDTVDTLAENEGLPCLEIDPIWGNQDPDYSAPVSVRMFQDGRVLAQFTQHNEPQPFVLFAVACHDRTCKIDDIYHSDNNGDYYSLKNELKQCTEENIRELQEQMRSTY